MRRIWRSRNWLDVSACDRARRIDAISVGTVNGTWDIDGDEGAVTGAQETKVLRGEALSHQNSFRIDFLNLSAAYRSRNIDRDVSAVALAQEAVLGVVRVKSKGRTCDRPSGVDARRRAATKVDAVLYFAGWCVEASDGPLCGSHETVDHARRISPGPRDRSLGIDGCSC